MHHTAIGDGHSAGYEVILKIEFVICHDKLAGIGGGGAKWRMSDTKTKAEQEERIRIERRSDSS